MSDQTSVVTHTPGPWTWVETPSAHSLDHPADAPDRAWDGIRALGEWPGFDELRGPDKQSVIFGMWCNDGTAEVGLHCEADARLIAAAPDLLVALKAQTRYLQALHTHEWPASGGVPAALITVIQQGQAAIAKSKAEK